MSGETKRDIDFYTLYDNEGRPLETFTVEVPTDAELRDYWIIATGAGQILGTHQTRIGRVKPEDILCNRLDLDGVCVYGVSREEHARASEALRLPDFDPEMKREYSPPRDERFAERFIRARVRDGKVYVRMGEEEWQEAGRKESNK